MALQAKPVVMSKPERGREMLSKKTPEILLGIANKSNKSPDTYYEGYVDGKLYLVPDSNLEAMKDMINFKMRPKTSVRYRHQTSYDIQYYDQFQDKLNELLTKMNELDLESEMESVKESGENDSKATDKKGDITVKDYETSSQESIESFTTTTDKTKSATPNKSIETLKSEIKQLEKDLEDTLEKRYADMFKGKSKSSVNLSTSSESLKSTVTVLSNEPKQRLIQSEPLKKEEGNEESEHEIWSEDIEVGKGENEEEKEDLKENKEDKGLKEDEQDKEKLKEDKEELKKDKQDKEEELEEEHEEELEQEEELEEEPEEELEEEPEEELLEEPEDELVEEPEDELQEGPEKELEEEPEDELTEEEDDENIEEPKEQQEKQDEQKGEGEGGKDKEDDQQEEQQQEKEQELLPVKEEPDQKLDENRVRFLISGHFKNGQDPIYIIHKFDGKKDIFKDQKLDFVSSQENSDVDVYVSGKMYCENILVESEGKPLSLNTKTQTIAIDEERSKIFHDSFQHIFETEDHNVYITGNFVRHRDKEITPHLSVCVQKKEYTEANKDAS